MICAQAGLILEILAGRTKHIWVTTNIDLKEDAMADLRDVGATIAADLEADDESPRARRRANDDDKAVVDVFALPHSSGTKLRPRRRARHDVQLPLEQGRQGRLSPAAGRRLVRRGLRRLPPLRRVALAKNLIADLPGTETAAAQAVDAIQHMLPNARVVYCSAPRRRPSRGTTRRVAARALGVRAVRSRRRPPPTRATRAPFATSSRRASRAASAPAALRAAPEARGRAPRLRTLSYAGAEFSVVEATLTPEQIETYDIGGPAVADPLHARRGAPRDPWPCGSAAAAGDSDEFARLREVRKDARKSYHSQLWSGHLRFFRSLITGFKVPKLVEVAKQALAEDKCVVIGLQSTGEAHAKRMKLKKEAAAAAAALLAADDGA